jgi:CRISPR-associated endonuclease/helicase Cas3
VDVSVVWRADLTEPLNDRASAIVECLPPRSGEALAVPIRAARRWLAGSTPEVADQLSDVEAGPPEEQRVDGSRQALRWRGALDDETQLIQASNIRPGDTLVVPSSYGGCDQFGWAPESAEPVMDEAAEPYLSRHAALRLHPALWRPLSEGVSWADARTALAEADPNARAVLSQLREFALNDTMLASRLGAFENRGLARGAHPYDPTDEEVDIPFGFVLIAKSANGVLHKDGRAEAATESDEAGSFDRAPVLLEDHVRDVADKVAAFAGALALPAKTRESLLLAAQWHDDGKADPRFQALLHEPFDEKDAVLAKSGRTIGLAERRAAGVPTHWRHEALSIRLAAQRLRDDAPPSVDSDLVMFLIGSHHGQGRPFFRHADPWDYSERALRGVDLGPGPGPERLGFNWRGRDWAEIFTELRGSYGTWGLAFLEAVLRLADHRASEAAEMGTHPRAES